MQYTDIDKLNEIRLNMMNRAYGSFMGVLCGDAAGATLEFYRGRITENAAQKAMTMPGGGQLQVGKGQITDDSEIAISMAVALYDKHPKNGFPLNHVANQYVEWFESRPFDMGMTCARAFSTKPRDDVEIAPAMMRSALESLTSESNGALMRAVPIGIWASSEPTHVVTEYAKLDAMLSHPNPVCQECNAVYALAIAHLIRHDGDYEGAINALDSYVENIVKSQSVKDWYYESSRNDCLDNLDCTRNIGHVRWGFTLAMYFLRNNTPYDTAIFNTLLKGGDTDTNAAIVGGILGALHGVDDIPDYMKEAVLNFDVSKPDGGYVRPDKFNSRNIIGLSRLLLTHDPVNHRVTQRSE